MTRFSLSVLFIAAALGVNAAGAVLAQEQKPVPKDSVRIYVPGCAKGYVFTAVRASEDTPSGAVVPEGTHLRLSGKKALLAEIKAHEGSRVELTGLIKKGQSLGDGVSIGGARVSGGRPVAGGGGAGFSVGVGGGVDRIVIDVEGWRPLPGSCPTR
ncbi:MAG: hypothetical protein ABMA15_17690 [Vicinamibacterales bacterium]